MGAWPTAGAQASVLERVDARAREPIHPGARLAKVAAGIAALITNILFCLGYVSARTLRGLWLAARWVVAAFLEGFAAGAHGQRGRPD